MAYLHRNNYFFAIFILFTEASSLNLLANVVCIIMFIELQKDHQIVSFVQMTHLRKSELRSRGSRRKTLRDSWKNNHKVIEVAPISMK
jgi:hypothetical protein